jgi:hypothetical protein
LASFRWFLSCVEVDAKEEPRHLVPAPKGHPFVGTRLSQYGGCRDIRGQVTGFFHLIAIDGRWWLVDPEGCAFLSVGVNHVESSALKYPDNVHIWRARYGTEERWLQEGVARRLREWGFNTIGWTQEVIAAGARHSPVWEVEQYRWAGMPYCHMLPFVDIAAYDPHPIYPDVFSAEFEQWVDYVARSYCVDMADDPRLIGYFYSDCPAWQGHERAASWASGLDLATPEGVREMQRIAARYYSLLHTSIRRYDKNHLILGDRYDGKLGIPGWLLEAMSPTVDVLSIQYYAPWEDMAEHLANWHAQGGKPILLADSAFLAPTELLYVSESSRVYVPDQAARGDAYRRFATAAYAEPYVLGWHWCAYIENRTRRSGIVNYRDEPYRDLVTRMRETNARIYEIARRSPGDRDER